jgi:Mg-chelatase subunit ChlI
MNPEEGDLRPQLLDRFALAVDVRGLQEPAERMAVLERHIQFEADPIGFRATWMSRERQLAEEIENARQLVEHVAYTRQDLATIANLTSSLRVDGHRADLVILKAARAHAALEGRQIITERDILMAAELALPHRIRRGPFQETQVSLHDLEERVEQARSDSENADESDQEYSEESTQVKKNSMRR